MTSELQPLLHLGWRLDYQRQGLVRPNEFIRLADLKTTAQRATGRHKNLAPTTRILGPGGYFFTMRDLENALAAFEAHEADAR